MIMAFFEDFGKKISQVGHATVQKTKEFADISKLNSMISDEEKRLNEIYLQLGMQYVVLHAEDKENEFADFLEQVRAGKEKIAGYKSEIEKIKGIIRCEKCGAEIAENSGFCSYCGAKVEVKEEALIGEIIKEEIVVETENLIECKKICVQCNAELPQGAMFCAECGAKVEQ